MQNMRTTSATISNLRYLLSNLTLHFITTRYRSVGRPSYRLTVSRKTLASFSLNDTRPFTNKG